MGNIKLGPKFFEMEDSPVNNITQIPTSGFNNFTYMDSITGIVMSHNSKINTCGCLYPVSLFHNNIKRIDTNVCAF